MKLKYKAGSKTERAADVIFCARKMLEVLDIRKFDKNTDPDELIAYGQLKKAVAAYDAASK